MSQKIQVLSTRLRWSVLIVSLAAACWLLINFFLFDKNLFNSSNLLFQELWAEEGGRYKPLLLLGQLPFFLLFGLFTYWLWRLFGQYAQGDFFGRESDRCYLWLIWLYGVFIPLRVMESIWISYLSHLHGNELTLLIEFDIGRIFTLFVLVSILYVLRAAKQIDQENKEFV